MSIIDLKVRLTSSLDNFHKNSRSSDSLIYINKDCLLDDGPNSVDLTIGKRCFLPKEGKYYTISDDGFKLLPFQSILIETAEIVAIPYNVFGMVTGKGKLIFQGIFISAGKIDPGFHSNLIIGLYNGGSDSIVVKKGNPLCSCFFIQTESIADQNRVTNRFQHESKVLLSKRQQAMLWIKSNGIVLGLIISIIAMLGSFGNFAVNLFK
jgi:deoxycytidine triphosphate deaminase